MAIDRRSFITAAGALPLAAGLLGSEPAPAMAPVSRTPGSRMKLSIAGYSFHKEFKADPPVMKLDDEFIQFAAQNGLEAIEPTTYYFPEPVTDEYLLELKRRAFLAGLDISGTAIGNTYTFPKGPERDEQIELTKTWIDRAAILGAPCIRVFAGGIQEGDTEEIARSHCIETLKIVLDYAASKGVFLALENHGGIVSTAQQMLAIVEAVDSPWFGVNLDTGNFHSEDPYREIERVAAFTITVQIKVEVRAAGEEKKPADLGRVIDILKSVGYRGYVALEYEADEDARTAIPGYLQELKRLV
jgi:sugar phosphate isomerase/epimerase